MKLKAPVSISGQSPRVPEDNRNAKTQKGIVSGILPGINRISPGSIIISCHICIWRSFAAY